jgi:hypothetical protein
VKRGTIRSVHADGIIFSKCTILNTAGDRGTVIVEASSSALTARLATLRHHHRPRHARISASVLSGSFRHPAAALSDVSAESHVAVEAGIGAVRIRLPNVRMPEVRPRSNYGHIERPHDIRRARLACRRVEAADLKFRHRGRDEQSRRAVEIVRVVPCLHWKPPRPSRVPKPWIGRFRWPRSCWWPPLFWLRDIDAALAQNIPERFARRRFKLASIPPTRTTPTAPALPRPGAVIFTRNGT